MFCEPVSSSRGKPCPPSISGGSPRTGGSPDRGPCAGSRGQVAGREEGCAGDRGVQPRTPRIVPGHPPLLYGDINRNTCSYQTGLKRGTKVRSGVLATWFPKLQDYHIPLTKYKTFIENYRFLWCVAHCFCLWGVWIVRGWNLDQK